MGEEGPAGIIRGVREKVTSKKKKGSDDWAHMAEEGTTKIPEMKARSNWEEARANEAGGGGRESLGV